MTCRPRDFLLFSMITGTSISFVPNAGVRCRPARERGPNNVASIAPSVVLISCPATALTSGNPSAPFEPFESMLDECDIDSIFNAVDIDGSDSIDLEELTDHLSSTCTEDVIQALFSKMDKDKSGTISRSEFRDAITKEPTNVRDVDMIFKIVDTDGSGGIDLGELTVHLSSLGYTSHEIQKLFNRINTGQDGEISRSEFRQAILNKSASIDAPKGYFLNSVKQTLVPLGPIGRISQKVETLGPFKRIYNNISNLFGIDPKEFKKLGIPFALSYSILSSISNAISFSLSWYISCKQTGLSPLLPGQWKSFLRAYSTIFVLVQAIRPFRVAGAIGMSKLSAEYLEMTKEKLHCSQTVAVGIQFTMGIFMMGTLAFLGVSLGSLLTGVPIRG